MGMAILVAAAAAFAQSLTVEYLDGTIELKTSKGWSALSIGDQVAVNGSIRVSQGGSVEFSLGKMRLSILKDGTYDISQLTKASEAGGDQGLGAAIAQKLRSLSQGRQGGSTTGGARGAEQDRGNILWADDSETSGQQISDLLSNGRYAEAIPVINKAVSEETGFAQKQEYHYYLASAYFALGESARAYRAISQTAPDAAAGYYPNYVLLKASILLDGGAYTDALALLGVFLGSNPQTSYAQTAYLISALCSRGLGDQKTAKDALTKGLALDPNSDAAKTISAELKK
jgi:tetratricopeptide (TPR) repeat protein